MQIRLAESGVLLQRYKRLCLFCTEQQALQQPALTMFDCLPPCTLLSAVCRAG
jgi:hypothetical protein